MPWALGLNQCQRLILFHLICLLIILPSNQCSLDVAIRHCWGNLQALHFSCLCFQTEVLRGGAQCDHKSLPPLWQNETSQRCSLFPYLFVSLCCLCKRNLVLQSQRSSLFILMVSGRCNKKEASLFNIRQ